MFANRAERIKSGSYLIDSSDMLTFNLPKEISGILVRNFSFSISLNRSSAVTNMPDKQTKVDIHVIM